MWENIEILNLSQKKEEETMEVDWYIKMFFTERQWKKIEILMNKPVYLGLSILELSKILMYEFWYDFGKTRIW